MISVTMSSNEKGSGRDLALLKEIDRHPERWTFGWDDPYQGLDLLFRLGEREIRWELKECPDMLQSSQDGHLYMQRMQAASYGHPAQIAVLGPDMAVLEHVPKVTKTAGWLNPRERAAMKLPPGRLDALAADIEKLIGTADNPQSFLIELRALAAVYADDGAKAAPEEDL